MLTKRSDLDFEVAITAEVVLLARFHIMKFYKCRGEDAIHILLNIVNAAINGPYWDEAERSVFYFSGEAARKVEAIASPHYHALLKAYEITKNI